jgi:3',5'-cyclic AMP phosphodiesterase CpdA
MLICTSPRLRPAAILLLLFTALSFPLATPAENWRWADVDRIVALSDVHGAYPAMVRTLQNAGVLDDESGWAGAATHLVVTGDILDRGPDSRKVMDLLMGLESEAAQAGGRVHVLLGNHEVMNLTGDLRYVAAAEYAAFADDEAAADRERAFEVFRSTREDTADPPLLERDFALRAPAGYFGHRRAFAADGRYGKWLMEKPLVVVINDTAFVHGGLSPMVAELGLDGVNNELRAQVAKYAAQLEVVTEAGLLDPTENFHRHGAVLEALPDDAARPAELKQAIADVISLNTARVHDSDSPVWYRGNVGCSALIEDDKLDAALATLGASRVVIGHTPTVSRQVLQRLGGRVVEIDTGMLNSSYGGSGHALIIEGDRLSVVGEDRAETASPVAHPRPTALEGGARGAADLERLLAEAEIRATTKDESGRTIVTLANGSKDLSAHFIPNPRGKDFVPELAAYRLDRLLALDMVPVTVPREVDGDRGVLQVFTANTKDEATRSASGDGYSAWCPLPEQWSAMYVFDALSYNALRQPQSIRYSPGNWQLVLVDHGESFAPKSGRPSWLKEAELHLGEAWKEALTSMSDEVLQAEFADVLDKRRLSALMKRRDALLKEML